MKIKMADCKSIPVDCFFRMISLVNVDNIRNFEENLFNKNYRLIAAQLFFKPQVKKLCSVFTNELINRL
ncbi:MAG: hypothetical protein HC917_27505 [Richelia sp. SM2_1_7]|nr:hypothetical protein [Richelia sp. SM2_1_7]